MNCQLTDLESEIKAMQLSRDWANNILQFSRVIEQYPQVLFVSTGEELSRIASSFGADLWHDIAQVVSTSLRDGLDTQGFIERCELTIYGSSNFDMARFALAQKYEELYDKFFVKNNAIFAYRLAERVSPKVLTFERISNLELIEYALRRNRPATWDGTTGDLFSAGDHADAGAHRQCADGVLTHQLWWGSIAH